jgi:hypothetical protein
MADMPRRRTATLDVTWLIEAVSCCRTYMMSHWLDEAEVPRAIRGHSAAVLTGRGYRGQWQFPRGRGLESCEHLNCGKTTQTACGERRIVAKRSAARCLPSECRLRLVSRYRQLAGQSVSRRHRERRTLPAGAAQQRRIRTDAHPSAFSVTRAIIRDRIFRTSYSDYAVSIADPPCARQDDAVASGSPVGIFTRIRHEQLDSIAAGHIR